MAAWLHGRRDVYRGRPCHSRLRVTEPEEWLHSYGLMEAVQHLGPVIGHPVTGRLPPPAQKTAPAEISCSLLGSTNYWCLESSVLQSLWAGGPKARSVVNGLAIDFSGRENRSEFRARYLSSSLPVQPLL